MYVIGIFIYRKASCHQRARVKLKISVLLFFSTLWELCCCCHCRNYTTDYRPGKLITKLHWYLLCFRQSASLSLLSLMGCCSSPTLTSYINILLFQWNETYLKTDLSSEKPQCMIRTLHGIIWIIGFTVTAMSTAFIEVLDCLLK